MPNHINRIKLDCCVDVGDFAEFERWTTNTGSGVSLKMRVGTPDEEIPRIELSMEDVRRLFNWLGVELHRHG